MNLEAVTCNFGVFEAGEILEIAEWNLVSLQIYLFRYKEIL